MPVWAVPTCHPAFLLRGAGEYTEAVIRDLAKAMRIAHYGAPQVDNGHLNVTPTELEIHDWIDSTLQARCPIGVDVENDLVNRVVAKISHLGLSRGYDNDPKAPDRSAICIWFVRRDGTRVFTKAAECRLRTAVRRLLRCADVVKTMQNGQHDVDVLISNRLGPVRGFKRDTMIGHQCFEPETRHALDFTVSVYSDHERWKDELKGAGGLAAADEGLVRLYNLRDTARTQELWPTVKSAIHQQGTWGLYQKKMRIQDAARRMSARGLLVDKSRFEETGRYWNTRIKSSLRLIRRLVGRADFDPNKLRDLQHAVYKYFGAPTIRRTGTGKRALDYVTLARVRAYMPPEGKQFIDELLIWKSASKIESVYLRAGYRDAKGKSHGLEILPDGCIHTSFSVTIPPTDRWSSSGPNCQNWPKNSAYSCLGHTRVELPSPGSCPHCQTALQPYNNLRRFVRARPGFVFVGGDFAAVELRIPAFESQDPSLCALFAEDLRLRRLEVPKKERPDIHRINAAICFACSEAEINEIMRDSAKRVIFGGNYGAGAKKQLATMRKDAIESGDLQMIKAAYAMTVQNVADMNANWFKVRAGLATWRQNLLRDALAASRKGVSPSPGLCLGPIQVFEDGRTARFLKGRCPHGSWDRGMDPRGNPAITEVLNRPVQRRASMLLNDTVVDCDRDIRRGRLGPWTEEDERAGRCSGLIGTVHDWLGIEVLEDYVDEARKMLQEHAEKPRGSRGDVFPIDMKQGLYWSDA